MTSFTHGSGAAGATEPVYLGLSPSFARLTDRVGDDDR